MSKSKKTTSPVDKNAVEQVIVKARYWSLIVYPDSAPADWIEQLQFTGLPFCISPLHDKDTNPTGEPKKPHWHVILCYGGPTTYNNVKKNIADKINSASPKFLQSVKGMYRYFTHQDNPEKYQYDRNEIRCFGGFSIDDYAEMTMSEEDRLALSIEEIIFQNHITELYELYVFLKENNLIEQRIFLRRHTYFFDKLIASLRHSRAFMSDYDIDPETGEVLNQSNEVKE